jgi:hypothetical protein
MHGGCVETAALQRLRDLLHVFGIVEDSDDGVLHEPPPFDERSMMRRSPVGPHFHLRQWGRIPMPWRDAHGYDSRCQNPGLPGSRSDARG